jgi:hypothetical protein
VLPIDGGVSAIIAHEGAPRSLRSLPPEGARPALGRPGGRAAAHSE